MSAVVASQVAIVKTRKASRYFTPAPLCSPRGRSTVPELRRRQLLLSI